LQWRLSLIDCLKVLDVGRPTTRVGVVLLFELRQVLVMNDPTIVEFGGIYLT